MANVDITDILNIEPTQAGSFIKTIKHEMSSHQVFLDEDVGDPSKYRELICALYMAGEQDEFNIFINSNGGNLDSCMAIVEGIKSSPAFVRAIINGSAHSAASMIALSCGEIIVTESASMMIHTASYGSSGSTHNVKSHTDFSTVYINKILDKIYAGFLTEPELVEVKKGVEMWFSAEDIVDRLNKRQEHRTAAKTDAPSVGIGTAKKTAKKHVKAPVRKTPVRK